MRALLVASAVFLAALAAPAAANCHYCLFVTMDACRGGGDACAQTATLSSAGDHHGAGEHFREDPEGTRNMFHCYLNERFDVPVPCDPALLEAYLANE